MGGGLTTTFAILIDLALLALGVPAIVLMVTRVLMVTQGVMNVVILAKDVMPYLFSLWVKTGIL